MSKSEASREAFEKWWGHPDRVHVADPPYPWLPTKEMCWSAAQWSRSQALEEAEAFCETVVERLHSDASGQRYHGFEGAEECRDGLRALKEQK